jgi:hypothetical protein
VGKDGFLATVRIYSPASFPDLVMSLMNSVSRMNHKGHDICGAMHSTRIRDDPEPDAARTQEIQHAGMRHDDMIAWAVTRRI